MAIYLLDERKASYSAGTIDSMSRDFPKFRWGATAELPSAVPSLVVVILLLR